MSKQSNLFCCCVRRIRWVISYVPAWNFTARYKQEEADTYNIASAGLGMVLYNTIPYNSIPTSTTTAILSNSTISYQSHINVFITIENKLFYNPAPFSYLLTPYTFNHDEINHPLCHNDISPLLYHEQCRRTLRLRERSQERRRVRHLHGNGGDSAGSERSQIACSVISRYAGQCIYLVGS